MGLTKRFGPPVLLLLSMPLAVVGFAVVGALLGFYGCAKLAIELVARELE